MPWPLPHEYNDAIQDPATCFEDSDLRACRPVLDALGLPLPRAGNFADVYHLKSRTTDRHWAVKCFTRERPDLHDRYAKLSAHLQGLRLKVMVDFAYLSRGIRVNGEWFPVLKMNWLEGVPLNQFIADSIDASQTFDQLCLLWIRLARFLRHFNIAHGDLQHGNILMINGVANGARLIRLIDYDGMFVPTLADKIPDEVGHPAYQHPDRLRSAYFGPHVDAFPHLVIVTGLHLLAVKGKELWHRYNNEDNLLFRKEDFEKPWESQCFQELWPSDDPVAHMLLGYLILASRIPMHHIPFVDQLVRNGRYVRRLTVNQENQVRKILAGNVASRPRLTQPASSGSATKEAAASGPWWQNDPTVQQSAPPQRWWT